MLLQVSVGELFNQRCIHREIDFSEHKAQLHQRFKD